MKKKLTKDQADYLIAKFRENAPWIPNPEPLLRDMVQYKPMIELEKIINEFVGPPSNSFEPVIFSDDELKDIFEALEQGFSGGMSVSTANIMRKIEQYFGWDWNG